MALTALEIKNAKKGKHVDGGGLYLQVNEAGAKSWIFRYQINRRRREMGLGSLYDKPAIEVRLEIPALSRMVALGLDPLEARHQSHAEAKIQGEKVKLQSITFEAAALEYINNNAAGWTNAKHKAQWVNSLALDVFPVFGSVPVANLTTEHVLAALAPIWITKTETATRVRQRIERIIDYARVKKYRTGENPALWRGHLEYTLPKPRSVRTVRHHPALPFNQLGEFIAALRLREGNGARALEFTILTASRSGEVRGARWAEIDLENRLWSVPAERMKANKDHRVPLSGRAMELLVTAPRLVGEDLVFPGMRAHTQLSDATLKAAIVRINEHRKTNNLPVWADGKTGVAVVPHGFRSSFRDWAAEVTHYPNEMAEMAVAHTVSNKVEAAYRRDDMFEKRRQMMEDWATWCEPKIDRALDPPWANVA